MPMVNGKKFSYDKAGKAAAMREAKATGKPMKKAKVKKTAKKKTMKKAAKRRGLFGGM
jgi:hypothetical protein